MEVIKCGLLDVLYNDGYLYFSYSHVYRENERYSNTAIARGKLVNDEIKNLEILLIGKPKLTKNIHWGSRIVIKKINFLLVLEKEGWV